MEALRSTLTRLTLLGMAFCALPIIGCGSRPSPTAIAKLQDAQSTFDRADGPGDYLRAAGLFQEVINDGFVSGAVFYNQGNAFMRAGRRGRAIASYRQALRYRPRDPELNANLNLALAETGASEASRKPFLQYLLFWQNWWGYDTKFRLSLFAGLLTLAMGLTAVFFDRRWLKQAALSGFALTAILSISAGYDWYRFESLRQGVVVEEVIARKGNGASYEPSFDQALGEGTEFTVLSRRADWLLIRLSQTEEGWVPTHSIVEY